MSHDVKHRCRCLIERILNPHLYGIWITVKDAETCQECSDLDGKVFTTEREAELMAAYVVRSHT